MDYYNNKHYLHNTSHYIDDYGRQLRIGYYLKFTNIFVRHDDICHTFIGDIGNFTHNVRRIIK